MEGFQNDFDIKSQESIIQSYNGNEVKLIKSVILWLLICDHWVGRNLVIHFLVDAFSVKKKKCKNFKICMTLSWEA